MASSLLITSEMGSTLVAVTVEHKLDIEVIWDKTGAHA
jgi:hypothetical protein